MLFVVRFLERANGSAKRSRPLFTQELDVSSIAEAVQWANDVLGKTNGATLARVQSLRVQPKLVRPIGTKR